MEIIERLSDRGRFPIDLRTRIMESVIVDDETGCWLWQKLTTAGYGRISVGSRANGSKRIARAHRVAYEVFKGPIPDGLVLDHLCRTPGCVNPEHLEPVTHRENILRGESNAARQATQTHCIYGHELTPDNVANSADGHRRCKECNRRRAAESRERRRSRSA